MRRKSILSYLENKSTGLDPASSLWGAGKEIQSNRPGLQQMWDSDQGDKREGDSEKTDRSWDEFFEQLQLES